jgi:hypothetical protein
MIIFATWNNRIAWLILLRFNLVSFPIEGSPWYDLDWWRNDYRHNTRFRIEEKVLGIWSDGTWLYVQNQGNMCGLVYVFDNPFHGTENFLYPYFPIENLVIPPLPLSLKFSLRNAIVDRFQWVNCWKKMILLLFFSFLLSPEMYTFCLIRFLAPQDTSKRRVYICGWSNSLYTGKWFIESSLLD